MGWHIEGGRRYYYRSRWVDGRPVREYVGTGAVAEAAATADNLRRVEREIQARQWRANQACRDAAAACLRKLDHVVELMVYATLYAAGYHQHDRTWRFQRDRDQHSTND